VLLAHAVDPEKSFADAMDLAFELENGQARGISVLPMKTNLSTKIRSVVGEWFN
jgi:hypothetical protein